MILNFKMVARFDLGVDNDSCSSFKQHCSVTFQVSYKWKIVSSANTRALLSRSRAKPAINPLQLQP